MSNFATFLKTVTVTEFGVEPGKHEVELLAIEVCTGRDADGRREYGVEFANVDWTGDITSLINDEGYTNFRLRFKSVTANKSFTVFHGFKLDELSSGGSFWLEKMAEFHAKGGKGMVEVGDDKLNPSYQRIARWS